MIEWQNIIALGLVGLAAGYLMRKAWLRFVGHTEGACDSCSRCGTYSTMDTPPRSAQTLVQIESPIGQATRPPDHPHDRTHGPIDHTAR